MSYVVCRYGTQSHIRQCESLNKSIGRCEPTGEKCDATRYVCLEVALRYARMKGRAAYNLAHGSILSYGGTSVSITERLQGEEDLTIRTYEEALQAVHREGK